MSETLKPEKELTRLLARTLTILLISKSNQRRKITTLENKTLEITREKLQAITAFAQEISERHDEKSGIISAIESVVAYSTDTSKKDLQDAINELSVEERRELSAIIWLGRGDYSSFEAAYEHAKEFDQDAAAPHYFEGIAEYIPAGITLTEKEGIGIS